MPYSHYSQISPLLKIIIGFNPKNILDIGIGYGTIGYLLRQYLDFAYGRLNKAEWEYTIDGMEIFENYKNSIWDLAYNKVLIGNAINSTNQISKYDMIICLDVIEHLEKEDALILYNKLLEKCDILIISTPDKFYPQQAWGGNENEMHRSFIKKQHLKNVYGTIKTDATNIFVSSINYNLRYKIFLECFLTPNYKLILLKRFILRMRNYYRAYLKK